MGFKRQACHQRGPDSCPYERRFQQRAQRGAQQGRHKNPEAERNVPIGRVVARLQPVLINTAHGVVAHHGIHIQAIDHPGRVRADPALHPGCVIAQAVIVQTRGIAFLAAVAHGFEACLHRTFGRPPGCRAKGVEPFLTQQCALLVQLNDPALQMI